MTTEIKVTGIKKLKRVTNPKLMQKAAQKTLMDMKRAVITQTAKEIGSKYTIKSARIKKGINTLRKATVKRLEIILGYLGTPPTLIHYKHKFTKSKKTKKATKPSQLSVTVKKGKKEIIKEAFIMPGKKPIFARGLYKGGKFVRDKTRLSALRGPSIKGMFNTIGGMKVITRVLNSKMNATFWRHYKFLIDKARGGK